MLIRSMCFSAVDTIYGPYIFFAVDAKVHVGVGADSGPCVFVQLVLIGSACFSAVGASRFCAFFCC